MILTSAVEGQGFVSIDGKRTYLNLFENSDRTSTQVQAQPQPTRTQQPAIVGTGLAFFDYFRSNWNILVYQLTTSIWICSLTDLLLHSRTHQQQVHDPLDQFEDRRSIEDQLNLRLELTRVSLETRVHVTSVSTKRAQLFKVYLRVTANQDTPGYNIPYRAKVRRLINHPVTPPP